MKKIYIIPEIEIQAVNVETLIAASPDVTVNPEGSVNAENVEVKGNKNYDVWDDDWSR